MSDLVWWTLFAILVLILVVISVKLCYRVISDVWCNDRDVYSEDNRETDDLMRYRTDSRTVANSLKYSNESDKVMMVKEFAVKPKREEINATPVTVNENGKEQMNAIQEEDENKSEATKQEHEEVEDAADKTVKDEADKTATHEAGEVEDHEVKKDEPVKEEGKDQIDAVEKDQIDGVEKDGKEEDEFTDQEKQVLEKILGIQGETDIYARQIPFCLGGKNHLTYFEINQNFIMNLIGLSSIDCGENDKLKRRKQMVSLYIQECQNELKKRADDSMY